MSKFKIGQRVKITYPQDKNSRFGEIIRYLNDNSYQILTDSEYIVSVPAEYISKTKSSVPLKRLWVAYYGNTTMGYAFPDPSMVEHYGSGCVKLYEMKEVRKKSKNE